MSLRTKYYCTTAYFASRLIYCLNQYGKKDKKYFNENTTVYRGTTLPYISLLPYMRAENKIILFSSFTSTSIDINQCYKFAKRGSFKSKNTNNNFSVVFYIENRHKTGIYSNGIDIEALSNYEEKEILYQAFSFYYVKNVKINLKERLADIYLMTIGKDCILEEEIKKGKNIEYNEKEKIMKIKK